jgi:hypothetical protein
VFSDDTSDCWSRLGHSVRNEGGVTTVIEHGAGIVAKAAVDRDVCSDAGQLFDSPD